MEIKSFEENSAFSDTRILTSVIIETSFSKEIRILLKSGQVMKEHKTPYPITVHILSGEIDFGVEGINHLLKQGTIVSLEGNVKHDLNAKADSVVRLTLSKLDKFERVEDVIKNS
ncbi:MAG: cupin [Sphingobacteriaceae bacterium]